MNKYVIAQVNVGHNPPNDLAIRILPIYAVAGFFTTPVRRCPNHTSRQDPSNEELREVCTYTYLFFDKIMTIFIACRRRRRAKIP